MGVALAEIERRRGASNLEWEFAPRMRLTALAIFVSVALIYVTARVHWA
jgi:hypothetical protein